VCDRTQGTRRAHSDAMRPEALRLEVIGLERGELGFVSTMRIFFTRRRERARDAQAAERRGRSGDVAAGCGGDAAADGGPRPLPRSRGSSSLRRDRSARRVRQRFGGNAGAESSNSTTTRSPSAGGDATRRRDRITRRVLEQVAEHLPQAISIAEHRRGAVPGGLDASARWRGPRDGTRAACATAARPVDRGPCDRRARRCRRARVVHVVDQLAERVDFGAQRRDDSCVSGRTPSSSASDRRRAPRAACAARARRSAMKRRRSASFPRAPARGG